jgi:membrane associated rhomboid family serine protease
MVKNRSNQVTLTMITVITAFYLAKMVIPYSDGISPIDFWLALFRKASISGNPPFHGVLQGEYWRLLTVALTHASLIHLGSNMLFLWQVGSQLERFVGRAKYIVIFLVSQIIASITSLLFLPETEIAVGVSGALFGLFAALVYLARHRGINYSAVWGTVALNVAIPFLFPGEIDWHAHVGGAIGGFVIAVLIEKFWPKAKPQVIYPPLRW